MVLSILAAAASYCWGEPVCAQGGTQRLPTLETLRQAAADRQAVPQGSRRAAAIRDMLLRIRLPPGFRIELYALVPDARQMALGPRAGVLFVGTRGSEVWAVRDRNGDGVADDVVAFAPGIDKTFPNGVAFDADGNLYVAEHNRVLVFPEAESAYEQVELPFGLVKDRFVPTEDEYRSHGYRVIEVGPDGKLYVAIGQPYNVWPRRKPFQDPMGTIVRLNTDGSEYEVFARGIRNSVGLDFHPTTGELWFTDNQVDRMGDDIPPEELNKAPRAGMSFGFPWYGGGRIRTNEWADAEPPAREVFPELELTAHAASLGMTFYTGAQFPAEYRNDIFIAQHGSWNRSTPIGARVIRVRLDGGGIAVSFEVFAEGWLDDRSGEYAGRPVDVVQAADGALLVSDDRAGAVYRISYIGN